MKKQNKLERLLHECFLPGLMLNPSRLGLPWSNAMAYFASLSLTKEKNITFAIPINFFSSSLSKRQNKSDKKSIVVQNKSNLLLKNHFYNT
jgi:hypothetical protein